MMKFHAGIKLLSFFYLILFNICHANLPNNIGISGYQNTSGNQTNQGKIELVVSSRYGGMNHWERSDDGLFQWSKITSFGSGFITGASFIQHKEPDTTKASVITIDNQSNLYHYTKNSINQENTWQPPVKVNDSSIQVSGSPSVIQSDFQCGNSYNLELLAPLTNGQLQHWYQDACSKNWHTTETFGIPGEQIEAVSLLQNANFSWTNNNNLEAIARTQSGKLFHFWRQGSGSWSGPSAPLSINGNVINNATGAPSLIQSSNKNFQLAFITTENGSKTIKYMYRDNSNSGFTWHYRSTITVNEKAKGLSLFQSNYGAPGNGNLELQIQIDHGILSYYAAPESTSWNGSAQAYCQEELQTNLSTEGLTTIPYQTGVIGMHAALLPSEQILFYDYGNGSNAHGTSGQYSVLTPSSQNVDTYNSNDNLFCSGLTFANNGKDVIAVGGHGTNTAMRAVRSYSPASNSWTVHSSPMDRARWYPTTTTLPNGHDVFVLSGTEEAGNTFDFSSCKGGKKLNDTYQIINATDNGITLDNQSSPQHFMNHLFNTCTTNMNGEQVCSNYALFPFVYTLPNNNLFVFSNRTGIQLKNQNNIWSPDYSTQAQTLHDYPRTYPVGGTSVLLPLNYNAGDAQIMVMGGADGDVCPTASLTQHTQSTNTVEMYDTDTSDWSTRSSFNKSRIMPDAVLLPDETIAMMNGSKSGYSDHMVEPVFDMEIYNIASDSWRTTSNKLRVPRLYHSTAILLPDATVLTAGKGELFNHAPYKYRETRAEIFTPPYLFHADDTLRNSNDRPRIFSVSSSGTNNSSLSYNSVFDLSAAFSDSGLASEVSAVLISPGAVTHSVNMHQRLIKLGVQKKAGQYGSSNDIAQGVATNFTITTPISNSVAPAGKYMLFVLQNGIPSVASWVTIN